MDADDFIRVPRDRTSQINHLFGDFRSNHFDSNYFVCRSRPIAPRVKAPDWRFPQGNSDFSGGAMPSYGNIIKEIGGVPRGAQSSEPGPGGGGIT